MGIEQNIQILKNDIARLSAEKMTPETASKLSMCYGALQAILSAYNTNVENYTLNEAKSSTPPHNEAYEERKNANEFLDELFQNHCEHNVKKCCLELREMCLAVYSTLENENEKNIFKSLLFFDKV